jgi:hypothetical protein
MFKEFRDVTLNGAIEQARRRNFVCYSVYCIPARGCDMVAEFRSMARSSRRAAA